MPISNASLALMRAFMQVPLYSLVQLDDGLEEKLQLVIKLPGSQNSICPANRKHIYLLRWDAAVMSAPLLTTILFSLFL